MDDNVKKSRRNQVKVKLDSRTVEDQPSERFSQLSDRLERLSVDLEKAKLREYVELLHKPWQLIWRNFLSGLSRGVGIALGFTFFAATIVYVLQILGALNLPIVGDYIADLVRIVQRQLEINPY